MTRRSIIDELLLLLVIAGGAAIIRQLRLVPDAAKAVPVDRRDEFLQRLARHLTQKPSDAAVVAALNAQLDALSHAFFV